MTDHPHAKLLEEARETSRNLRSEQHPEPIDPKAIYRTRSTAIFNASANTIDRLAAALETAPSASLVKALHPLTLGKGTDFRTELDFRLEVATLVDPRVRRKMVRPETRRRILERADWIIKAIRERYPTAHPAADAPPSDED